MKRIFAFFMLTVVLFCAAFPAALADINPKVFLNPGHRKAMQAAGRAMDYGVAWAEETEVETPFAVFLRKSGETAQLTLLEKLGEGWQVTACNDTIPVSLVSTASFRVWRGDDLWPKEGSEQEQQPHFSLIIEKMEFPYDREDPHYQMYCSIRFGRTDAGTWALDFANIVPFEEVAEGRSPYYLLDRGEVGWVYRFYEEIFIEETSFPVDRSPMIAKTYLPLEALAPFENLAEFSLPEFLDFLRSLAPEEYEHAPFPAQQPISPVPQAEETSPAAPQVSLYYIPDGGKYYHVSPTCPSVSTAYWPLTPLSYEEWISPEFAHLLPCYICDAPYRLYQ